MASDDHNDYQDMEERLYAQIHHDHLSQNGESERQSLPHMPSQVRPDYGNNQNRGRYWAPNDQTFQNRRSNQQFDKRQQPQHQGRGKNAQYQQRNTNSRQQMSGQDKSSEATRNQPQQQNFVIRRYQNMFGAGGELNRKQFEKRAQTNNFPKKKGPIKGVNPFNVAMQDKVRLENKIRVMQKKKKALTRQQTGSNFKVPELPSTSRGPQSNQRNEKSGKGKKYTSTPVNTRVVFVDSCSDGESIETDVPDEVVPKEEIKDECDLDASQDDDVIMIPAPAPVVVSLLDSDDDSDVQEMVKAQKDQGSRCVSPSNSSILSDDFIGQNDRTRLQSEFLFVLPEDEDLQGADKNKSTSSEDSSHSEDTSPIKDPRLAGMPGQSTVGNLGDFIVRGEAVENSLSESIGNNLGHQTKKGTTDGQFANAEDNSDYFFTSFHHQSSDDDTEDEEQVQITEIPVQEEQRPKSPERMENEKNDDVIVIHETSTEGQAVASTSRKRTTSDISSDCDIMLNISSKHKKNKTNDNQAVPNSQLVTIEIDDDNDDGEPRKLDPEIGWNKEMKRYYHESWGGEQFNLRRILGGMGRKY